MSWSDFANQAARFAQLPSVIDNLLRAQPQALPPPVQVVAPPVTVAAPVELPYSPHVPVPQTPAQSFSDQLAGQQPQKAVDTALAELSSDVYETSNTGAAGWTRLDAQQLADLKGPDGKPAGIDAATLDTSSGFRAAVYTNGQGQYVVAFAGTNGFDGDIIADAGQGLGIGTPQYKQAVALAKEAEAAFGDNVVFTGHSLGGGLASTAALATGNTAVTFNAAGLSNDTLRDLGFTPHDARSQAEAGQIRRYNVDGDPLTGAQQGVELINGMPDAVGYELNLDYPYDLPLDMSNPLNAHGCATVIDAMKTQVPTPTASIEGDELGLLDRAAEDLSETAVDLLGDAGDEVGGLLVDGYNVGADFVGDVGDVFGNEYANGRYFDGSFKLTGDLAEGVLNFAGDTVDGAFNLAGDTLQGAGELTGGLIRDVGEYVGLEGASDTVAGWVEDGGEWLGARTDDLGNLAETAIDGLGTAAEATLDFAGDVTEGAVNVVKDVGSFLNPFD